MIAGINTTSPRTSAALTASTVVVSAGADLWKYIAHQPQSHDGAWVTPEFPDGNVTIGPACQPCLFNLRADPEERHDLSQVEPELVARLAAELGNQTHFQTGTTTSASTRSASRCRTSPRRTGGSWARSAARGLFYMYDGVSQGEGEGVQHHLHCRSGCLYLKSMACINPNMHRV